MAAMTSLVKLIYAVVLADAARWPRVACLVRAVCRLAGDLMRPRGGRGTCRSSGRRLPAVREQLVDAAVELGGQAVYIPYQITWAHEQLEILPAQHEQYFELEHLGQLPILLELLENKTE